MTVHRVAVLALDGMAPLDLAIPLQIFGPRAETAYQVTVCAPSSSVSVGGGFTLAATGGLDALRSAETVIVPGFGLGFEPQPQSQPVPPAVLDALATARDEGRRVVSICTGAFALAAAGLLDGLHATTHWQYADELERRYPAVHVDRDVLYVDEGDILTSAGVCCGIDLCLHIVRRDLGAVVANQIARNIVAAPHREGGQAQYVPAPVATTGDTSLADTRAWALERLAQPLTVPQLARHAGMSERSLLRRFAEETGTTPLQWLVNARLGLARELLETTDQSIDLVARDCGLGSAANLRLYFRRALNTTPTAYRRAFTRQAPDPAM
ncbi:AraC family transcriptional regulator [Streptacidiphilus pinicola]|uniref:AraC family transcriptional regulator n=1 Tax=Streptacidiphilus pinicola TaxID=2219663 RepID=A0A2X0KC72_9ACTN|nr:helix-turn-helix domain-containing protein [Streptacidiphilus pinicola]RAG86685.1 AraC family transcriptional regulator [Streptacidiphilus pinicola]